MHKAILAILEEQDDNSYLRYLKDLAEKDIKFSEDCAKKLKGLLTKRGPLAAKKLLEEGLMFLSRDGNK